MRKEHYLQANSLWGAASNTASIIGTGTAAFILGIWGIGTVVLIDALTFLFSAVTAAFAKIEESPATDTELTFKQFFSELSEGVAAIRANTSLIIAIIMACAVNLLLAPFNVLLPAYSDKILLAGAKGYSMIEAFFTIGIIAGSIIIGKLGEKFRMSTLIVAGFAGLGIGIGLLGVIKILGIAVTVCFLTGAFIPLIDTSALTVIQLSTPKEKMGRVISTLRTICLLGMPLGFAVSGFIAAGLKIESTYLLVGVLILLLCIPPFFNKEFRKV